MTTVAFVGLGRMGLAMAGRLLDTGFTLRVFNRTPARAESLVTRGARRCASPAEAAREAEFAITMMADDAALRAVALGPEGLVAGLPAGGVHLSMSTVSPDVNRELAAAHQAVGSDLVAAPVLGRPEVAAAGMLWLMPAGSPALEVRCQPLIAALSRGFTWVGDEPGLGNIAKLAVNGFLYNMAAALGEALTLVEKHGGDRQRFFEVVSNGFGSQIITGYGRRMVNADYLPAGFTSVLALKDISLLLDLARSGPAPLLISSLVRDYMLAILAHGRHDWDVASLAEIAREHAGLT